MSDPTASHPQHHHTECPDCHANPDNGDTRIITAGTAGTTETWHLADCPQHTVDQILSNDSAQRGEENEAWARGALPAAFDRLQTAAAALPDGSVAAPFVAALVELVQAQADRMDGMVTLPRWVEILVRHFPPQQPDAGLERPPGA